MYVYIVDVVVDYMIGFGSVKVDLPIRCLALKVSSGHLGIRF